MAVAFLYERWRSKVTLTNGVLLPFMPVEVVNNTEALHVKLMDFCNVPTHALEQIEPQGYTALYSRLSNEDDLNGESNSIMSQKRILERYCEEHKHLPFQHYIDDGYSGTNFNRPDFIRLIADIKAGKVVRVVVKDMSRFGRDYLQVGMYTDVLFPELGVHFVAVNDGVDSTRGENEFTAIRNIFNEMFARDTSKKIRASLHNKGKAGEHLCNLPPYGYLKDPSNKKKWVIDMVAAAVDQKIFALCTSGVGTSRTARWLRENKIKCPAAHFAELGILTPYRVPEDPYRWTNATVSNILGRLDYLGHTVNFKTTKQSYKSGKYTLNSPDIWQVFENTHEPIIEESVFWAAQRCRAGRRRPTRLGDPPMLSGLVFCGDCGSKMYFHRRSTKQGGINTRLLCSEYKNRGGPCSAHYLRLEDLEEVVLRNLREAISYVTDREKDFIKEATELSSRERDREHTAKKNTLLGFEKRIAEIDMIIKRLCEDSISSKLSDERFSKLLDEYEKEQASLNDNIVALRSDVEEKERSLLNTKDFIAITRKYTDLKELDATILRAFIDKIYVFEKDKQALTQEIRIVYNFIGAFRFDSVSK
jgi:DNA invertase Pin-like site-specific DNA recombinase